MRNIKVKERDRTPRVRNASARLPKELMKAGLLKTKERTREISRLSESGKNDSSPSEYASDRLQGAQERLAIETGSVGKHTYAAGKRVTKKTYEKIKERKRADIKEAVQQECQMSQEDDLNKDASEKNVSEKNASEIETAVQRKGSQRRESPDNGQREGTDRLLKQREKSTKRESQQSKGQIRTKPEHQRTLYREKQVTIKQAPKEADTLKRTIGRAESDRTAYKRIKQTGKQGAALAKKQVAEAKAISRMSEQYIRQSTQAVKGTVGSARKLAVAIEKALSAVKAVGMMAGLVGGMVMMVLVIVVGILGGVLFSSTSQSTLPLSDEVLSYTPLIQLYAQEYGIGDYVQVIQAIMMQESVGQGTDPMQCSECPYNTKYPNTPGAITDPEYSIQVGIRYYADCVKEAKCTGPDDLDRLKLSLQGYNFGNGYIAWAVSNYGGYSEANAMQFSQEQAAAHGWAKYGDPEYVAHVLCYYASGNIFAGLFGNGQMVSVALSQLGNSGGQKFWSWYGFDSYVAWCACFASWCGDQCGLIESGTMPKFSYCDNAITWFKAKDKWQGRNHIPSAGTLIFFDWLENGVRDGVSDHVGIVEKCEGGVVYTVEGNSSNAVRQRSYTVGDASIMGYGVLEY